jgi:predicted nuclease of predicted toxin-antitoxin system
VIRLLLDQNLSPALASSLRDLFDAVHVRDVGLAAASDSEVWAFAAAQGRTIVTKDSDFDELAVLRGSPPHVVWLRIGNCTTRQVAATLRSHATAIQAFCEGADASIFVIDPAPTS